MPMKVFSLRTGLLPAGRLSTSYTAKYGVPITRVVPLFSRIFPLKLKYRFLEPPFTPSYEEKGVLTTQIGVRKFSVRSGRARSGSGSGHEVRVAKSLIEDEAELSEWVSGLSSNSFRKSKVYSDIDVEGNNGGDNGGYGRRERGEKRRKESEFDGDDFDFPNGGNSVGRGLEKPVSRGRGGYGGGLAENRSSFNGGRSFDRRSGTRNSSEYSRKGKFGSELEKKNERNGGGLTGRGKGWGSVERFPGREVGKGIDSRVKRRGASGSEMGYGKDRGGSLRMQREGKRVPQRGLVVTDEDEEEEEVEGYRSFKELIDSDEVDDEDEDESEEEDNIVDDVFEKEKVLSQSPPSSSGGNDTYLSESR